MGRRTGSENRQRTHMYTVRFSASEAGQARKLAERSGLSLAALIRQSLFNVPPPRSARRPTANHKAIARLMGQLGKIGSNINQLAKHANAGRYQEASIELAMRDLMELRTACLQALGREPNTPDMD